MTLFLDSARVEDASRAAALGYVSGITTNPGLIVREPGQGAQTESPIERTMAQVRALGEVFPGVVMAQLTARTALERAEEARRYLDIRPGQVGLKIPAAPENFALARAFSAQGYVVGITTIFSAEQAYLACEAGAAYIFPYVNRSTRLMGDGLALVRQMRGVIDALQAPVKILAASIKTPQEGVAAILAGAHGLTLPLEILLAMGKHPLSEQSIEEFDRSWPAI